MFPCLGQAFTYQPWPPQSMATWGVEPHRSHFGLSHAHHHGGPDTRPTLLRLTQVEEYVNRSCPKLWQNLEYLKNKVGITHAIKSHNKGIHLNDPIPKFQFTSA